MTTPTERPHDGRDPGAVCPDCGATIQWVSRNGREMLRCPWARDESRVFGDRIFCGMPITQRVVGGLSR